MTKVDDEMAQEFLRLSDLGHTYVDIGKQFSVNHRTVSDWVKRARNFTQRRHWEEIVNALDTRYMDEHHQMLLATARGVLRAVDTPLPMVNQGQQAMVLMDYHVIANLRCREELLARRGISSGLEEIGASLNDDYDLLEGMAVKLREGLLQHVPGLRASVDLWASDWQAFRDQRVPLVQETAGALEQSGQTAEAAHELAGRAVGMVLTREVGDREAGEINDDTIGDDLGFAVDQVTLRMDPIRETQKNIRAAAATCRSLVEDLILRGGPPGRCPSCPEGARTEAGTGRQGSRT